MSKEYPCVYYKNGTCAEDSEPNYVSPCVIGPCSKETPSNADRIRTMSDEEIAKTVVKITRYLNKGEVWYRRPYDRLSTTNADMACYEWIKWLQQPVEER